MIKVYTIGRLVKEIGKGHILLPPFHPVWDIKDILLFLDSIYNGYPTGQIVVQSDSTGNWHVVDGKKRVLALLTLLSSSLQVGFDPQICTFCLPHNETIPLTKMFDQAQAGEWLANNKRLGKNEDIRRKIFEASTAIRQYQIAIFILPETVDVNKVLLRTNRNG